MATTGLQVSEDRKAMQARWASVVNKVRQERRANAEKKAAQEKMARQELLAHQEHAARLVRQARRERLAQRVLQAPLAFQALRATLERRARGASAGRWDFKASLAIVAHKVKKAIKVQLGYKVSPVLSVPQGNVATPESLAKREIAVKRAIMDLPAIPVSSASAVPKEPRVIQAKRVSRAQPVPKELQEQLAKGESLVYPGKTGPWAVQGRSKP
jgi:hypothetical protein